MKQIIIVCCIALLGRSVTATAQLKLPSLIDDNMVLQQGKPVTIWGWNTPGTPVKLEFQQRNYKTVTDTYGDWQLVLPAMKAGKGGDMIIRSGSVTKTIHNVAIGEVWVCSGQSNMEWLMSQLPDDMKTEVPVCRNSDIRYLTVKKDFDKLEREDAALSSKWQSIDSNTLGGCSSVAYYFGRKLYERLKVPVGLLVSSWGGTPAQAWTDTAAIRAGFPNYYKAYQENVMPINFKTLAEQVKQNISVYKAEEASSSALIRQYLPDNYDDKDWTDIKLPKFWEDQGYPELDGVAAIRFSFNLTEADLNAKAILHMPAIDDADTTWINGKYAGSAHIWNEPRSYPLDPSILKAGKNQVTIWVLDTGGAGGLFNDPDNFYIQVGDKKILLAGPAKFKILAQVKPLSGNVVYAALQNQPSVLYNAMIHPLLNYAIRGAIWYQGESNADRYAEYRSLFPAMITCWRKNWKQGDFPFLFVQLSSFNPNITEPKESLWAGLREAQTMTLRLPNTGMAVTTDVGDLKDIHPRQKRPVGERLALNAFKIAYGFKNEVNSGPVFSALEPQGDKLVLSFTSTGSGLMNTGSHLDGFQVAGDDKNFVPADALIMGNKVQVSSRQVKEPVYVRYAWADAPLSANLFNKEGLPAVPFRTDKD